MRKAKPKSISDDDIDEIRLSSSAVRSTDNQIVLAVNRIIDGLDIDLDSLQKGASAGMILSIERLTDIIGNVADDDIRIKAINSLTSIANHIIRRRELALEEGGSITVNVSATHVPPSLSDKSVNQLDG
jgi:hypothetical protein